MTENIPNPIKAVEEKLAAWSVFSMPHEEKVEYFKGYSKVFERLVLAQDPALSVTVHESLFEAASQAFSDMTLREDFVDTEGGSWEENNEEFRKHCAGIVVRQAPSGYFATTSVDVIERIAPDQLFVQVMTPSIQGKMAVQQYDQSRGISAKLARAGVRPMNEQEHRMIVLIAALLEQEQSPELDPEAVLQATAANGILR